MGNSAQRSECPVGRVEESEMIAAEGVDRAIKRVRRMAGWSVVITILFGALSLFCMWAVRGHTLLQLGAVTLVIIPTVGFMWMVQRNRLTCPACKRRIEQVGYLKRTGRCNVCRTVIMTSRVPDDALLEERKYRNALLRTLGYLLLMALLTPLGMRWLDARQLLLPNRNVWQMTFAMWGFLGFFGVAIGFALWDQTLRKRRMAENSTITPPYPALTVVKPTKISTRVYRIYLAPERICFARVAAMFYDEDSPIVKNQAGPFLMPFLQRALRRKRRREALYDTIDPASADLLAVDPENFHLDREEVRSIAYTPLYRCSWKQRIGFATTAGILTVISAKKEPLTLGVVDDLSESEINAILSAWREQRREDVRALGGS